MYIHTDNGMICVKSFSINCTASCKGLAVDAPWIYLPDPIPPHEGIYTYDFEGYYGTYQYDELTGGPAADVYSPTHRLEFTDPVPHVGQIRITHNVNGVVNLLSVPGPGAQNFTIRAYSNGILQDVSQLCNFEAVTNINLTATAISNVTLNNVLYVLFITNTRGMQSVSGETIVHCE